MELTLRIPDPVYRTYASRAADETQKRLETGGRGAVKAETIIGDTIRHFASAGDGGRWLLVPPAQREELEKLLGSGHVTSPHKLVSRIRQRMGVAIEGVDLKLTDAQHARITRLAERARKTPQEYLQKVVDDVAREFLGRV